MGPLLAQLVLAGTATVYYPGDGHTPTERFACKGAARRLLGRTHLRPGDRVVATRLPKALCGASVEVRNPRTGLTTWALLLDRGPWSCYNRSHRWLGVRCVNGTRRVMADLTPQVARAIRHNGKEAIELVVFAGAAMSRLRVGDYAIHACACTTSRRPGTCPPGGAVCPTTASRLDGVQDGGLGSRSAPKDTCSSGSRVEDTSGSTASLWSVPSDVPCWLPRSSTTSMGVEMTTDVRTWRSRSGRCTTYSCIRDAAGPTVDSFAVEPPPLAHQTRRCSWPQNLREALSVSRNSCPQ